VTGPERIVLLGPQRRPTLGPVARSLDLPGPVATVTAGWQEREPDDSELDGLLDRRSLNLRLHARWQDVLERDPAYASAETEHRAALREQRELHIVQLDGAVGALREVARRGGGRPALGEAARADAEAVVRLVDERHLARVREARAAFEERWRPGERTPVAEHRDQVRGVLDRVSALVVAGGHVELLLHLLRLFELVAPPTVIAWSAGAMALTERVLLFHDRAPQPPVHAEFLDAGLGVVPGCVLLPHARRRLRTDDGARMAELACRAAPAHCVVLDDGVRLDLDATGTLPAGARVVGADGRIGEVPIPEPAR
jgi:hypothetical protein